ncbi:Hypothetical protein CINCED_3A016853 [Cinara cedri]|uniref:Uncharacterized protein n=1 Tax=Cinara cedri TaxID=506608 RepID=A0A5E4M1F4_9HEMI|nr:Hypothetical protein CINCED_3A016853 [Cinara cedri]
MHRRRTGAVFLYRMRRRDTETRKPVIPVRPVKLTAWQAGGEERWDGNLRGLFAPAKYPRGLFFSFLNRVESVTYVTLGRGISAVPPASIRLPPPDRPGLTLVSRAGRKHFTGYPTDPKHVFRFSPAIHGPPYDNVHSARNAVAYAFKRSRYSGLPTPRPRQSRRSLPALDVRTAPPKQTFPHYPHFPIRKKKKPPTSRKPRVRRYELHKNRPNGFRIAIS